LPSRTPNDVPIDEVRQLIEKAMSNNFSILKRLEENDLVSPLGHSQTTFVIKAGERFQARVGSLTGVVLTEVPGANIGQGPLRVAFPVSAESVGT
jgi:hypothetical protein